MGKRKEQVFQEPHLNELAPDFEVMTTSGVLRLSDYRGRWVVLFAHMADFTPVCTSEIVRLAEMYQQFRDLNCEIISLSVDSRYTHAAWLQSIKENFGVSVPFPMIDDQSHAVANAYGMVHPDCSKTCTVRSTFLIDNEGRLRMRQHYPDWVGRSIPEILRVVKAVQLSDHDDVAIPEGWRPGDPVVRPPAQDAAEHRNELRVKPGSEGWFSSLRKEIFDRHH